jgi:hypothetical protein
VLKAAHSSALKGEEGFPLLMGVTVMLQPFPVGRIFAFLAIRRE